MRIKFRTNFNNIKPFMVGLMHRLENITLDRQDDPMFKNIISDLYYIVLDTTGIFLLTKEVKDDTFIVEANNVRALECSLYLASQTHELDETILEVGDDSYKERYLLSLTKVLKELGLDQWHMEDKWSVDKNGDMIVDLNFSMEQKHMDYCMFKLEDYVENSLNWDEK